MTHQGVATRREFLGTCAVVAAGGWAAAHAGDDPYGGFRVGVQSYSFCEFPFEQCLKQVQGLGLKWIEITQLHLPVNAKPEAIQAARRLCGDYGITPIAYGVQHFTKNHDANKKIFDFGKELGIKHLSASPDMDAFDSLDKLVDEYKISIAIHPHGPVGKDRLDRWYSAEIILAAVKDHHPLIGSCLDTGHLIRAAILGKELDPAQQVRVMGARNFGMHLKDNDNSRDTNVVLGKGKLNVPEVVKALREVKFDGYLSLEYEANPKNPTPDMAACLEVLREAIKQTG
jgi:sugar phosphate isomerase/epimerase